MSHPPGTKLPQGRRLAPCGHFAGPFPVHALAEVVAGCKGEIDQFNPESLLSLKVGNEQAVMRLGRGMLPSARPTQTWLSFVR